MSIVSAAAVPPDEDGVADPELTAVPTISSAPQEEVQVRSTTVSLELPDGLSVLFQATVSFTSPVFLDRIAEYPGTIYLVAKPATNEDQIILCR